MNWKKWLGIAAFLGLVGFVIYSIVSSNDQEDEAFSVRTATVEHSDVTEYVSTQGIIQPVNQQEVVGQGVVVEVHVEEGDSVSEGDTLVEYAEMGEITANFSGTVTAVNIEDESPDTNAQMGQPSIIVESLDQLEVKLDLSQNDAHEVSEEQPVTMNYQSTEYKGTVTYVAAKASDDSNGGSPMMPAGGGGDRTLEATVSFDDDQETESLIAGFEIDVDIEVDSSEEALVIPIEALNFDEDGNAFVFVVEDGVAKEVAIETGIQSDLVIEVVEGDLSENDEVILSPDESLTDGSEVTPESDDSSEE